MNIGKLSTSTGRENDGLSSTEVLLDSYLDLALPP
jgi:hypothetical protein